MTRTRKQEEIAILKETLENSEIVVLTYNKGLNAKSITDLRLKMRENDVTFKIVKNTLAKIATKGTRYEQIADMFTGPVGMATATDPVAAAKVANEFAKKNDRLVIIGGAYGDMILDEAAVKQLASLPSLDELRSKIIGLVQAPAQKIAQITQIPAQQLVGVTKAYSEKA
ncbi:MAG: 50S ribosomal protein L10 [Alphaproteobacteria bacterium]|nr:50S ribosomal protein L10 [Alphaproteobacteria bacterium]NCQ88863.1 50S ribosomal protein L10 [Alphaproteobacteria bacterium]NCT07766.1 50S ribosomal protein L10 [Alphaproteobacteria bacterium]